jgi:hypothetical protein
MMQMHFLYCQKHDDAVKAVVVAVVVGAFKTLTLIIGCELASFFMDLESPLTIKGIFRGH